MEDEYEEVEVPAPAKYNALLPQKTMETNPPRPIVIELSRRTHEHGDNSDGVSDMAWLLYDTALRESGFTHDDVPKFTACVLLRSGLHLSNMDLHDEANIEMEEDGEDEDCVDEDGETIPTGTRLDLSQSTSADEL